MRTDTDTLASAMMILSRDIYCEDGVATAAIAEAGRRLIEQRDEIARLRLISAEREAIQVAAAWFGSSEHPRANQDAVILRAFLDRSK